MNAAAQLQMFEPEAGKLADLVSVHTRNADFEMRRFDNLNLSGYKSAAAASFRMAGELYEFAAVCEMALQFEQLAGLA